MFRAKIATSKVRLSYLDVRNEVANFRLNFRGVKIKNMVLVMYKEIENSKETINRVFRDTKARSKA